MPGIYWTKNACVEACASVTEREMEAEREAEMGETARLGEQTRDRQSQRGTQTKPSFIV